MRKPAPPGRRRHLTEEDKTLWEHTASSLKPLPKRKDRHLSAMPDLESVPPFVGKAKGGKASEGERPPKHAAKASAPVAVKAAAPELMSFDRKAARKLRQGQIDIEARIDLHGMRQHEAHIALRRFLLAAYKRGQRWVLVITGKGGPRARREAEEEYGAPDRGVLRRNVPMWLAEPELRAIVVSFTSAAISHGGEGALYIQLRNPDRAR